MSAHKYLKVSQQVILRNAEGQVLLVRTASSGNWYLPGGRIEEDDASFVDALRREVREEIGCEIEIGRAFAVDGNQAWETYAVAFEATAPEGFEPKLSEEHTEYRWLAPADVPNYLYYKNIASAIAERLG